MPDRVSLLLLGASHRTADADRRGRLALTSAGARAFLQAARTRAHDVLDELLVLSTCNRVEFYAVSKARDQAERALRVLVEQATGTDALAPGDHRYRLEDEAACRHLARVACGLDSMVVGEAEILGQVRAASALAKEAGTLGVRLERVVSAALGAGGRARSETAIGIGSTSVATAAVALGERVLRGLTGKRVVIVGAGQAGRLALSRVLKRRPSAVVLANRTIQRAEEVVASTLARAVGLEDLPAALASADLVLVAAHGDPWLLSAQTVEAARRAAREETPRQRLVIIDIAMPAGVEPAVRQLDGVRAFGLDELRGVVEETRRRRSAVVPLVEAIAAEHAARAWQQWLNRTAPAEWRRRQPRAIAGTLSASVSRT